MYILKIKRHGSNVKNVYSCENFDILGSEAVVYRYGTVVNIVNLSPSDTIYIMDTGGNTIDSFQITPAPLEEL